MSSSSIHAPTLFEPANFCDHTLEAYDQQFSLAEFSAGFATPLSMESTNDSPSRESSQRFDPTPIVNYSLPDMPPIHTDYARQASQGPDFGPSSDSALTHVSAMGERTLSPEAVSDPWTQPWPVQQGGLPPPPRHESHGSQGTPPTSSPKTIAAQRKQSHNRELDRLLWQLKRDIPDMSWNAIASNIQACLGEAHQVPALQMRYKRLRERRQKRMATENNALLAALKYYEENKWSIVSEKMTQSVMEGTWPPEWCERRWLSLEMERLSSNQTILAQAQAQAQGDEQLQIQAQNVVQNRQPSI